MGPGGQYQRRTKQALTGTLACVLMVGCGRWGSQIGIPPVYIGDVLLVIAVAHMVLTRMFLGRRAPTGVAKRSHPGLVVGLLVGWALLRFAVGGRHDLVALRDLAPYCYGAVAFLAASAYAHSSPEDRARTLRLLEGALVVQLLWVLPGWLAGRGGIFVGSHWYPFEPRPDVDGTILGVTACLFLMRYLQHGGARRLLGALCALAVMSLLGSRASILASLAGLLLTGWSYLYSTRTPEQSSSRRRLAVLGVAPFVLVALLVTLPQTTSGSKLLVSVGIKPAESSFDQAGIGTKQARTHTWDRVISYTERTTSRRYAGVGFGPNIMLESGGSLALLSGEIADVRSPHNYFLGSYARLGLIGITLLALLVLSMLGGIWRVRRLAGADDLLLLAALVPPMILVEATFGVVLESPFGAIPFFWFLGILLTKPVAAPEASAVEVAVEPELAGVR